MTSKIGQNIVKANHFKQNQLKFTKDKYDIKIKVIIMSTLHLIRPSLYIHPETVSGTSKQCL